MLIVCNFLLITRFLPQVLRTHVMVRVGGGWDTLEHYLDKHDPCRCAAFGEVTSYSRSAPYKTSSLLGLGSHNMTLQTKDSQAMPSVQTSELDNSSTI